MTPHERAEAAREALVDRLAERFVFAPDGCWLWTGAKVGRGYGSVFVDGRSHQAHRVMYELLVGPIPAGLTLDHLCQVKHCVNPGHLEPVTNAENIRRSVPNRLLRTRCKHGHVYTPETARLEPKPSGTLSRRCRICEREKSRRLYYRERAGLLGGGDR